MAHTKDKSHKLIAGYCRIESNDMNIIDGIISIIFEYQRFAQWSSKHKGDMVILSEDDTKATCGEWMDDDIDYGPDEIEDFAHSVRADFHIERGKVTSWELESQIIADPCNFFGVVSSQVTNFNANPADSMMHAYGLDDSEDEIYFGENYTINSVWSKPEFPLDEIFKIQITADWTQKQCKLTFFYNGTKLNEQIDDYTMLLPELDNQYVWYPCVAPYNEGAYCIIR